MRLGHACERSHLRRCIDVGVLTDVHRGRLPGCAATTARPALLAGAPLSIGCTARDGSAGSAAGSARCRRGGRARARGAGPRAPAPGEPAGLAGDGGRGRAAGRTGVVGARRRRAAAGRDTAGDPVFAGALRVAQALEGGAASLGRGVAARAAAGAGPPACARRGRPGRRRSAGPARGSTPEIAARLDLLSRLVTGGRRCRRRCWPPSRTANC